MDTFVTRKGSKLQLMNLKGKAYMQVAQRLIWFNEEVDKFNVEVELPIVNDDQTLAKVTVSIFDTTGNLLRKVTDYKREHKIDFKDHTEKAITGSLGRALLQLGFGTAFALSELDEGARLADTPVEPLKKSTFRKPSIGDEVTIPLPANGSGSDGWE